MLADRYEIKAELGRGGMGVVYRGFDTRLGRDVAIKFISTEISVESRTRLMAEARAAAQLNHPNIVTVYDAVDDVSPFIVMELVEGSTLRAVPITSLDLAIQSARQICAALEHAHSKGIIHRDLKPDNVLVLADHSIKLMDFGLARSSRAPQVSQSGEFEGTAAYIAPELLLGESPSPQSDIYALGIMLFEMLTGRQPYTGDDFIQVLGQHLHARVPSPQAIRPDLPETLNELVMQMLDKQPGNRPSSTALVGRILGAIQAQQNRATVPPESDGLGLQELERLSERHVRSTWDGEWRKKGYLKSSLPVLDPTVRDLILSNQAAELKQGVEHLKKHRLLVITGMPGIGKSTLARALLEFMPAELPPPFWHDFERQQSSGNTLSILLDRISSYLESCLKREVREEVMSFRQSPGGRASAHDVDLLIDFMNQDVPVWLIFDNLETVLARGENGFVDPDLELLFDGLKNNMHNAKVIITNPFIPILRDGNYLLEFGTRPLKLQGIDEQSSIDYLRAHGLDDVPGATLAALAGYADGHPFTLNHIAHYVQSMGVPAAMENLQGGLGEITTYLRSSLEHRLSPAEFDALQSLSVLKREIPMEGLCQTAQTSPATIRRLREEGLLQTNDTGSFWLHAIVRNSLKGTDPELTRSAHVRAASYYRGQTGEVRGTHIDDFAGIFEWHFHAVRAGDVESSYAALFSTGLYEQLVRWNEYHLLAELCEAIISAAKPPLKRLSRAGKIKLFQSLGVACFFLGELDKSMESLQSGLDLAAGTEKPELKIDLLIHLAYAHNKKGDAAQAMSICEQAFKLFPHVVEDKLLAKALHLRGNIHKRLGNQESAAADLEAALQLYDKLDNVLGVGNTTGDLGILYYYQGNYTKAIENYRRTTASCEMQGYMFGVLVGHYNIGDFLLQDGQYEQAIPELRAALELARKKKIQDMELLAGFGLVDAQLSLTRCDEAEAELNKLQPAIHKEASSRSSGVEQTLQARLHWKRGRLDQALEYFNQGLEQIDQAEFKDDPSGRAYLAFAEYLQERGRLEEARLALRKGKRIFSDLHNKLGLEAIQKLEQRQG